MLEEIGTGFVDQSIGAFVGRVRIGRHRHDLTVSSGLKTGQLRNDFKKHFMTENRSARGSMGEARAEAKADRSYCGFCSLFFLCCFFLLWPFLSDFLSGDAEEAGGAA